MLFLFAQGTAATLDDDHFLLESKPRPLVRHCKITVPKKRFRTCHSKENDFVRCACATSYEGQDMT